MKNLKILVLVLLACSWLLGCQQEEAEVAPISNQGKKVVSAEDIPSVVNTLLAKMGLRGNQPFAMNNGNQHTQFDIDWDEILQLIDSTGRQTYTFRINDTDEDATVFYNLILKYNEIGDAYNPFIMKYDLEDDFAREFYETGSMVNFTGTLTRIMISANSNHSNSNTYNNDLNTPKMVVPNDGCNDQPTVVNEGSFTMNFSNVIARDIGGGWEECTVYEDCHYYWESHTYDSQVSVNGSPVGSSGLQTYWTLELDYCETTEVCVPLPNHTEVPNSGGCDTGDGEIPVLHPNELKAQIWNNNVCEKANFVNNTCVQEIWSIMKQTNTAYKHLTKFLEDDPKAELCFDIQYTANWGIAANAITRYNKITNEVDIILNSSRLNRYKLDIAKTILHETIHAEIFALIVEAGGFEGYESFVNQNPGLDPFQTIWIYMNGSNNVNSWQHEYMADNYLVSMAESLRELAPFLLSDGFRNYVDNYTVTSQDGTLSFPFDWNEFFVAIAWQGLHFTEEWQNLDPNLKAKYDEYRKVLQLESNSFKCD